MNDFIAQIPARDNRNIRVFYILSIINNASFAQGNWIFFWTRYMTYGQLGLVDALAFAYGIIMEVPTGAVSDLIGKKRTLVIAYLLSSIGILLISSTNGLSQLIVGFYLGQTGWALHSGAVEAVAYDSLKEKSQEHAYPAVISTSNMVGAITRVVTVIFGGLLYASHFRAAHYAWGLTFVIGLGFSLVLREPDVETFSFSARNYIRQLIDGTRQLWQPSLRYYVPLIFCVMGFYFMFNAGLIQPIMATEFGFYADEQAALLAVYGVSVAALLAALPLLRRKFGDFFGLVFLAALMGVAFIGAALPIGYWGFLVLFMIHIVGRLGEPWISVVVNKEIPSQYRATTLSAVALIYRIPYVITAIFAGRMAESGTFWLFCAIIGAVALLLAAGTGGLYYLSSSRASRDS